MPFLDRELLDVAMALDPAARMAGGGRMEKHLLREAFADLLPASAAWRRKEQFSDGVGYGWIETLRATAEARVSERGLKSAAYRFPHDPPATEEAYLYRALFAEHFPHESCAECVPGGKSVACSTPEALARDASFAAAADPSGRAVRGVHASAYRGRAWRARIADRARSGYVPPRFAPAAGAGAPSGHSHPSSLMDFPLQLRFKIMAVSPQISVTDAAGRLQLYVKQKAFKLKEAVTVFADEAQTRPLYHIAADRILDISAKYNITAAEGGALLGTLQRHGMRSLWRVHYELSRNGVPALTIREENPWVKVMDALFGEIPVLGIFTGYLFHPAYLVTRSDTGEVVMRAVKQPAFLEGKYSIERKGDLHPEDEVLAVLNVLMMLLLERRRG